MPNAVKWRQINNCIIMFDLLKLIQKKEELACALAIVNSGLSDDYRCCFGCEGDCSGTCSGTCIDTCDGYCEQCGSTTTSN